MEDHQQYFLYRPLLSYIITELKGEVKIDVVNLFIIFISEHLCEYKSYLGELEKYRVKVSMFKDRDNKAHTHFCRTLSMAANNAKSVV
jgi:hypothetical protein